MKAMMKMLAPWVLASLVLAVLPLAVIGGALQAPTVDLRGDELLSACSSSPSAELHPIRQATSWSLGTSDVVPASTPGRAACSAFIRARFLPRAPRLHPQRRLGLVLGDPRAPSSAFPAR